MALTKTVNYKTRIFLIIIVFTWVVSAATFGIFYLREKELKAEVYDAHLQIYNAQLLYALRSGFESGVSYIDAAKNQVEGIRFTILDTHGRVLYDTSGGKLGVDYSGRNEIRQSISNGEGFTMRRQSTIDDNSYFYSAMRGDDYIVRTSVPYDFPLVEALKGESVYLWTVLVVSVVLSIIAFFASRRLGMNIDRLRDFAIKAEKGENPEPDDYDFVNDELGDISSHIVQLYNKEREAVQDRDKYYQNLLFEEKEKTRIKHQLTNNINHELKTPVHAIQGCLETVLSNSDRLSKEQMLSFIGKAREQALRLCSLLNDISMITRISEGSAQFKREHLDLVSVVQELPEQMSMLPEAKRMRLHLEMPSSMPIVGNKSLLESIFQNLMANSVAYSGGRDIYVEAVDKGDEYAVSFSDNGVGIDESHFSRIFERFYRIDEGRSRKAGGTGLGLSIVKNAVNFHGGEIKAQTRHGGGMEFLFTLKKQ